MPSYAFKCSSICLFAVRSCPISTSTPVIEIANEGGAALSAPSQERPQGWPSRAVARRRHEQFALSAKRPQISSLLAAAPSVDT